MKSSATHLANANYAMSTIRRTAKVPGRYRSPRERRWHGQAKRSYRESMFWYRRALAREQRQQNALLKIHRTGRNRFGMASRWISIASVMTTGFALVFFGVPGLLHRWMSQDRGRETIDGACGALSVNNVRGIMFSRRWLEPVDALPSDIPGCSLSTERFGVGWILAAAALIAVLYLVRKLSTWDPITSVGWGTNVLSVIGIAAALLLVGAVLLAALLAYAIVIGIGYFIGLVVLINVLGD